jgi:hypothetical protein
MMALGEIRAVFLAIMVEPLSIDPIFIPLMTEDISITLSNWISSFLLRNRTLFYRYVLSIVRNGVKILHIRYRIGWGIHAFPPLFLGVNKSICKLQKKTFTEITYIVCFTPVDYP